MIAVMLALVAATAFGSADYFGGVASRQARVPVVLLYSHLASVLVLALALWLLPQAHPTLADYGWGTAAGGAAVAGMSLLYFGLAMGPMAVVAPVTAVCVAAFPATAGLASGERLSGLSWFGLLLGICGVGLVSLSCGPATHGARYASAGRALLVAVGAGTCLGAFFIVLSRTSPASGLVPLTATRAVTLLAFGALLGWRTRREGNLRGAAMTGRTLVRTTAAGILDMAGNAFYLVAVRNGPLAVIAVLTALYPTATVAMAKITLGERISVTQAIGAGAAIAAAAMLAVNVGST